MKPKQKTGEDPLIDQALAELQSLITQRYPEASFDVVYRQDPDGMRLRATVDIEDPDEVMDLVIDKLYQFQVEQELPVYVVPVQPLARVAKQLRAHPVRRAPKNLRPLIQQ